VPLQLAEGRGSAEGRLIGSFLHPALPLVRGRGGVKG
jgi:hypothetical protein